jgi:hypothetical protein
MKMMSSVLSVGLLLLPLSAAYGQDPAPPPVLLVLDSGAIDFGPAPHLLPADAVNTDIAGVGVRDELVYFSSHVGSQVVLTSSQSGNDAWFALRTIPSAWESEPGLNDGLENFALAGPGLGSPDDNGDRESLLDSITDVMPVRADGLALLVGRTACAVVYGEHVVVNGPSPTTASLRGATLGRVAFTIVSLLPTDDPAFPNVQVQIVEGHEACSEQLVAFSEAPAVIQ